MLARSATLKTLLIMFAMPPPVQSSHQGASHSTYAASTSRAALFEALSSARRANCGTSAPSLPSRTCARSTLRVGLALGLPAYMLEPVNGHGPCD